MLGSNIDERMAELIRRNMVKGTGICTMQTHRCNFDPIYLHCYIVKLGSTGICLLIASVLVHCFSITFMHYFSYIHPKNTDRECVPTVYVSGKNIAKKI